MTLWKLFLLLLLSVSFAFFLYWITLIAGWAVAVKLSMCCPLSKAQLYDLLSIFFIMLWTSYSFNLLMWVHLMEPNRQKKNNPDPTTILALVVISLFLWYILSQALATSMVPPFFSDDSLWPDDPDNGKSDPKDSPEDPPQDPPAQGDPFQ